MTAAKPKIAIVDDDLSVCRALKRLIRSFGMEADTFRSGEQLLEFLEAMPLSGVDCVVLDVQMPGLSGLEVQERLTATGCMLPVILITAHDTLEARERAFAQGAVAFLRKPFDDELLMRTLQGALRRGDGPNFGGVG